MGLDCSCGVRVNGSANNVNVKLWGSCVYYCGKLTYLADVCADRLDLSSLSLIFRMQGQQIFEFIATNITSVTCKSKGQNCQITVSGVGEVNGKSYTFTAVFIDQVTPSNMSIVSSFVINGFFNQIGSVALNPGDITALGCGED